MNIKLVVPPSYVCNWA